MNKFQNSRFRRSIFYRKNTQNSRSIYHGTAENSLEVKFWANLLHILVSGVFKSIFAKFVCIRISLRVIDHYWCAKNITLLKFNLVFYDKNIFLYTSTSIFWLISTSYFGYSKIIFSGFGEYSILFFSFSPWQIDLHTKQWWHNKFFSLMKNLVRVFQECVVYSFVFY